MHKGVIGIIETARTNSQENPKGKDVGIILEHISSILVLLILTIQQMRALV